MRPPKARQLRPRDVAARAGRQVLRAVGLLTSDSRTHDFQQGAFHDGRFQSPRFRQRSALRWRSGIIPGHRAAFRELVDGHIDILFANEAEICSLYETDDFAAAAAAVRDHVAIAALTRSAAGSVILADGAEHMIAASPVARVVDTTGAGDLYAAGFLYGLTHGLPLRSCGAIGSLCAAEIISHIGARPETALSRLVAKAGLA